MRTLFSIAILLLAASAPAQIPTSNRVDWIAGVTVGVLGGIPARETVFTNLPAGASAAPISSAIQAAPSNSVVQLAAGTNLITTYINWGGRDGVTLRGHPDGTVIRMTNSGVGLMFYLNGTGGDAGQSQLGVGVPLVSGYTKGASNVTATSVSGLSSNQVVIFTQNDDTNFVFSATGNPTNGYLRQRVVIQAISGTNITFWPPLVWTLRSDLNPRYYAAGNQIERSGIEGITWLAEHADISAVGYISNAKECWFSGNRITGFQAYGPNLNWTVFTEIRSNYIYGSVSTSDGYAVRVNSDNSSLLVEDNALGDCFLSIIASQHTGSVFAFNYSTNSWINNGYVGMTKSFNANHGPHGLMSLWEGNVGTGFLNDGYHGSSSHQTIFRNHFPAVQNIHSNAHGAVLDLRRWSYYHVVAGNVLGAEWATNHSKYQYQATEAQWNAAAYNDNGTIWLLGSYQSPYDTKVESTLFRAFNWDGWTDGVADGTISIPESLFRSERPSWFGGVAWPPIGPDVSGRAQMIPAEYRFRGLTLPSAGPTATATSATVGTLLISP